MTLCGRYLRSTNERRTWTPHLRVYSETVRRFESNVCVLCHEIYHLLSTFYINNSKANKAAYLIVFEVAHLQGCESQNCDWSPVIWITMLYETGKWTRPYEGLCSLNWDGNWPIWSDATHEIGMRTCLYEGVHLTKLSLYVVRAGSCASINWRGNSHIWRGVPNKIAAGTLPNEEAVPHQTGMRTVPFGGLCLTSTIS
jgi:hypothetical protein